MSLIPIYLAERNGGLEQAIRGNTSVAIASVIRLAEKGELSDLAVAKLKSVAHQMARGAHDDFDLHHLTTVLVTVGWNRNDDVFDSVETWVARKTPEHKQLNYEHDHAKIVGHITSNWVMDDNGGVVAEDTAADALPGKFHIITDAVLYKCWRTPELQKQMDDLIAEIAEGKWFVSMECLFNGFDYALRESSGATRIVARNEKTAFLSKHLRCYGGSGEYGDAKVGRLMRNIVFSGKGLVRNPANPESVILSSDTDIFSSANAEYVSDFSRTLQNQVYSPVTNQEIKMTVTVEQLQLDLDKARAENAQLKANQQEAVVVELRTKVETAEAKLKNSTEELAKVQAQVIEVNALKAEVEKLQKSLAETSDELKALYSEQKKVARTAQAKDKLKLDDAAAAEFVTDNVDKSDEAFAKQIDFIVKTIAAQAVTNNPQSGNTSFDGAKAKPAPKSTDKPTAPKATSKPVVADATTDANGEGAVDATDLETAKVDATSAALATTVVTESGVSNLGKTIAEALGYVSEKQV